MKNTMSQKSFPTMGDFASHSKYERIKPAMTLMGYESLEVTYSGMKPAPFRGGIAVAPWDCEAFPWGIKVPH